MMSYKDGGKKKKMSYGDGGKKKMMMQKGGKLKMVMKDGKMVPFYAADGKGKMQMGGRPLTEAEKKEIKNVARKTRLTKTFGEEERATNKKTGKKRVSGPVADKKGEKMQMGGITKKSFRDFEKAKKKATRKANAAKRKMAKSEQAAVQGKMGKAARKMKKARKKAMQSDMTLLMKNGGKKKMMGGGMKKMYQSGGFIERGTFDLDRDSIL